MVRDEDDLDRHVDYIHYNPVKHGLARCPHAWPYSSFHRFAREGHTPPDGAASAAAPPSSLDFSDIEATAQE